MGVLLQPDYSSASRLKCETATDHLGMFSGLDSILAQRSGNQNE